MPQPRKRLRAEKEAASTSPSGEKVEVEETLPGPDFELQTPLEKPERRCEDEAAQRTVLPVAEVEDEWEDEYVLARFAGYYDAPPIPSMTHRGQTNGAAIDFAALSSSTPLCRINNAATFRGAWHALPAATIAVVELADGAVQRAGPSEGEGNERLPRAPTLSPIYLVQPRRNGEGDSADVAADESGAEILRPGHLQLPATGAHAIASVHYPSRVLRFARALSC